MATVNEPNPKLGSTVRLFDQFYAYEVDVPVNEYDAVNSYFLSVFKTREAAQNFTVTLFRVSQQTNVPALTLLGQLQDVGTDQIKLTAILSYFLNGLRSPSTLLGVNSTLTPNFFTARNVLP